MSFDDAYRTTASPRLELPQGNSFPKKLDRGDDDDDDVEVEVRACVRACGSMLCNSIRCTYHRSNRGSLPKGEVIARRRTHQPAKHRALNVYHETERLHSAIKNNHPRKVTTCLRATFSLEPPTA